jgi:superfamily II DNA or RNA helicase
MELRSYQEKIIYEIKKNLLAHKKVCIQSPCGSGKSVVIGKIINDATKKGNRVLFLVHRKELTEQIYNTLLNFNIDFNLVDIMMVQTACRRLEKIQEPTIIITDENHHCLAKSYTKIYDYFKNAFLIGFTATPIRLNGEGLGNVYNYLIKGEKISWLIDNNYLSPYKLYSVKLADTNKLHIKAGEYKKDEVNKLMEGNIIYGKTIENYIKLASGKKTIVYCASIESSISTAKAFNDNNIPSKHLDGSTPKNERNNVIKEFRENKIQILCNVDLFGEGFDVPDCECVILLRPTKSLSLYIQQSMRSMRYKENKEAIIIDHVGNCFEHNLPDFDHDWTLEGKKKKENEIKIKECPHCFAVIKPNIKICPYCGHSFQAEINIRKEQKIKDIELEQITKKQIFLKKPFNYINKLNTLSDIIDFVEIKKYKPGVILFQLEKRDNIIVSQSDLKRFEKIAGFKRGWWTHHKNLITTMEV